MVVQVGVLALLTTTGAFAQRVAYSVFGGPYSDAVLNRVDLVTGQMTAVGPIGTPVTHIAFNADGTLFGIDPVGAVLLVIDHTTGSVMPVGALGGSVNSVHGMTFDSGGGLWMTAYDAAFGASLFEVDSSTGGAVWKSSVDTAYVGALASLEDTVYMASHYLSVIDTSTGHVDPVIGSHLGIWTGRALDFDDDGALWGLMLCGPCMLPYDLLINAGIDPVRGRIVEEGPQRPHGVWGLAILPGGIFVDGFEAGDLGAWLVRSAGHARTSESSPALQ